MSVFTLTVFQGSKLTVASSKFAIEEVGSKKLQPGNSVVKVIFGK